MFDSPLKGLGITKSAIRKTHGGLQKMQVQLGGSIEQGL